MPLARSRNAAALFFAAASLMATGARAEGDSRITGLWKLVSYEVEIRSSGEKDPVMGAHPTGYAYFTPEGRVFFNLTGEGRKGTKETEGKARLLDTLVAYTTSFSPGLIDADPKAFGTATAVLAGPFRLAFTMVAANGVRSEEWRNLKELPPRIELSAAPVGPGRVPAAPLVLLIPAANPLISGAVAAR